MDNTQKRFNHCYLSLGHRESPTSVFNVPKENIQKLLELLNTLEDKEIHAKIFTILTTQIISNNDCSDMIITCSFMYDKILGLLSKAQPIRTAKMLYFLSSLLYIEEEEVFNRKKSLVIYAQNMIRNSGCLLAMCNLFIGSMMHQGTWRALCKCLAEVCQNSHENQTYCRHLVPLSVEKCIQGDKEVILTLNNLISNHERNMQLFLECRGITIFNKRQHIKCNSSSTKAAAVIEAAERGRELLQYDNSMQLLDSLVQKLSIEPLLALQKIVYEHLEYYKSECSHTPVGQWATLILYHMKCRLKGFNVAEKDCKKTINSTEHENSVIRSRKPDFEETAKLLQNVIREIYLNTGNTKPNAPTAIQRVANFRSQGTCRNESTLTGLQRNTCPRSKDTHTYTKPIHRLKKREASVDLSFSFLLKQPSRQDNNKSMLISPQRPENAISIYSSQFEREDSKDAAFISYKKTTQQNYNRCENSLTSRYNDLNINSFKPTFASTPNQSKYFEYKPTNLSKMTQLSRLSHKTIKRVNLINKHRKVDYRHKKEMERCKQDSMQHRSMSTRFFDAINESCTTIVKTVKNIFRPKKDANEVIQDQSILSRGNNLGQSCTYSFTEYMRKRDAILSDKLIDNSKESESKNVESCKTCNDTIILKRKIQSDDFLKQTVKKLKLGINLYGCDFKKISRTMWPRESYMTPEVLYNLYRRVILK